MEKQPKETAGLDRLEVREVIDLRTAHAAAGATLGFDDGEPTGAAAAFALLALAVTFGLLLGVLLS